MEFEAIKKMNEVFSNLDFQASLSKIQNDATSGFSNVKIPELPTFDPDDTVVGEIKREVGKQIQLLNEQNKLLTDNYNKLKEIYDAQSESYQNAREDLKRSRRYNAWMMTIATVAMLAAIAGPIVAIKISTGN